VQCVIDDGLTRAIHDSIRIGQISSRLMAEGPSLTIFEDARCRESGQQCHVCSTSELLGANLRAWFATTSGGAFDPRKVGRPIGEVVAEDAAEALRSALRSVGKDSASTREHKVRVLVDGQCIFDVVLAPAPPLRDEAAKKAILEFNPNLELPAEFKNPGVRAAPPAREACCEPAGGCCASPPKTSTKPAATPARSSSIQLPILGGLGTLEVHATTTNGGEHGTLKGTLRLFGPAPLPHDEANPPCSAASPRR
jgi:hypothetical protein